MKSTFLAMTVLAAMTAPAFAQSAEKLPPPIMVDAKTEIQGRPGKSVKTPILWEKVRPQAVPPTYLAAPTATPATTSNQNGTVVISSQTTSTFDDNNAGISNAPPATAPGAPVPLAAPAPASSSTSSPNPSSAPIAISSSPTGINSANEPTLKSSQFQSTGYAEVGGNYDYVSGDLGDWSGAYFRSGIQTDPRNIWSLDTTYQNRFDDNGFFASIGNTHLFNENWFTNVSFGASSGGFFFPSYRVDAFVNYKVPSSRQFIATVGVGASDARDTDNSDVSLFVGGAYYFQDPWIVQGGVRYNISSPGSVGSTSEFIAVTQGRVREHFYTLRYEFGEQAYQVIANNNAITDFNNQVYSAEARQWFGDDWGINALGEYQHNDFYDRTGLRLGVFKEF